MSVNPQRRIPRLGWAIAFLAAATVIAIAWVALKSTAPEAEADLPPIAAVPDFTFTSQTGEEVSKSDLLGNVWIANFVFTRCPGPCPAMTGRMAELQKVVERKGGNVRLVTVTVDPEHDTPEVLAKYGESYQNNPEIWSLLTGENEVIQEFVTKGMLLPLATDPDGLPSHSQKFIVVDAEGQIRTYHDLDDPELLPKLLMDIGQLMREHNRKKSKLES